MIEAARVSVVDGEALPGARAVSLLIYQERESLNSAVTVMHMTLGQLIDHDIGRTAVAKLAVNDSSTGIITEEFILTAYFIYIKAVCVLMSHVWTI